MNDLTATNTVKSLVQSLLEIGQGGGRLPKKHFLGLQGLKRMLRNTGKILRWYLK